MARLYSSGKGVSESTKPYNKIAPIGPIKTPDEIKTVIIGLAKKGISASKIGKILRDDYGIGQAKFVIKQNLLKFLKESGFAPEIPEELECIRNKCINLRGHLAKFTNDKDAKYRLNLAESKMYRVARYFLRKGDINSTWKPYDKPK